MQIVREIIGLAFWLNEARAARERLALVPTMGALHDGHLALVAAARREADRVVTTIFVNPLQFNDPADLERYPRSEEADIERLEAAGCDMVWLPSAADLYPQGFATSVIVRGVSERWEGEHRPGHFDGVATVVAKLLIAIRPDSAIFGEKDWQQVAVVRRLVEDLHIGCEVIAHPTVREVDGLAMSSRNGLLTPTQRAAAPALYAALRHAAGRRIWSLDQALDEARGMLIKAGFGPIDYLALVDEVTLEPLADFGPGGRVIAAAYLGAIRLIDNLRVL